jgi:hypothetical protein
MAATTGRRLLRAAEGVWMMRIALDKVCEIVVLARAFDAKVDVVESDYGSNPSDENAREVLEDFADDPTLNELTQFIGALNVDEQIDLVALAWLGRGDDTANDWDDLVAEATRAHEERESTSTAEYLLGMPMLGEFLEQGLSELDLSCEGYEPGDLTA